MGRAATWMDQREIDVSRRSTSVDRRVEFQNLDGTDVVIERSHAAPKERDAVASVRGAIIERTVVSHAVAVALCGLAVVCARRIISAAIATAEIMLPIKAVAGKKSYARGNVRAGA